VKITQKMLLGLLSAVVLTPAFLALTGCETRSSSATVSVSPSSVTISQGQSITFTARGGYEYTWSLESGRESWGTLSTRNGDTTVYTSRYSPSNSENNVQIVHVTAWIEGAGTTSSGTNSTSSSTGYSQSGEAYVTHL
jgi:hypothetical protein